jgi:hypothetical protein
MSKLSAGVITTHEAKEPAPALTGVLRVGEIVVAGSFAGGPESRGGDG